jgi:shikimate kinase
MLKQAFLKYELETYRTKLNHLLVIIIAIGGGSFGILVKEESSILSTIGIVIMVKAMVVYILVMLKEKIVLNEMKKEIE